MPSWSAPIQRASSTCAANVSAAPATRGPPTMLARPSNWRTEIRAKLLCAPAGPWLLWLRRRSDFDLLGQQINNAFADPVKGPKRNIFKRLLRRDRDAHLKRGIGEATFSAAARLPGSGGRRPHWP